MVSGLPPPADPAARPRVRRAPPFARRRARRRAPPARSLAGFKVSARIHAHMLLPVWRHGQFPAPRSSFLPSLRWSHNFQEHGLKAPSPQRPSEILCVFLRFLRPFLFWGSLRSPCLSPPLPRSQTCLLPSPGPGRSCLPEARRRRAALSPAAARRLSGCAEPPTQVGDLRLLAAAACGPCLPRAPGIVAACRLLALLARLALF